MIPQTYNLSSANHEAESIARVLAQELNKTIAYCKKTEGEKSHWLADFFLPAQSALIQKNRSAIGRLADACIHLQVFGGMGSWSDVGGGNIDELYAAYKKANDFYQECWEQGLK